MYRWAEPSDMQALVALWKQVFEDEEGFIRESLESFAGFGNIYVAENDAGHVQAMLMAVPCRIDFTQGVYLYALATAPEAREKGVMAGLMTFAERRAMSAGAEFAVLIPANAGLFGYYINRGYMQDIVLRYLEKTVQPGVHGMADFSRMPASQFARLRERYVRKPMVNFSADRQALILADLYASGAHTVQTLGGYAVYYRQENRLLVAELFARSDKEADELLAAMAEQTGVHEMILTLPYKDGPYAAEGQQRPAALIKQLEASADISNVYLRFAMDVVTDSF